MKNTVSEYVLLDSADNFYKIIRTEINRKAFDKQFNLSGNYPNYDGVDIYNYFSLIHFQSSTGPLVKLNLKCINTKKDKTKSKLILKRINGLTYKLQFWFLLFFVSLTIVIAIYQILKGNDIGFEILVFPIFGIIYILVIELIAELTIHSLKRKVEKLLKAKKLILKKI